MFIIKRTAYVHVQFMYRVARDDAADSFQCISSSAPEPRNSLFSGTRLPDNIQHLSFNLVPRVISTLLVPYRYERLEGPGSVTRTHQNLCIYQTLVKSKLGYISKIAIMLKLFARGQVSGFPVNNRHLSVLVCPGNELRLLGIRSTTFVRSICSCSMCLVRSICSSSILLLTFKIPRLTFPLFSSFSDENTKQQTHVRIVPTQSICSYQVHKFQFK